MAILAGKVAIVTGAGIGIGRCEAVSLGAAGAAVVVNDIDSAAAREVTAEIVEAGGRAIADAADMSLWTSGGILVQRAVAEFGQLDIVVANAGVVSRSPIADVTERDLDAQIGVLFKGTYALVRHCAAHWRAEHEAGRVIHRTIIATSSSAGVPGGVEEFSVYGSLKAGVATLALGAALELRRYGVTVNAILPHAATRMDAQAKGTEPPPRFDASNPDPMNPQHVANVVTYLASERAAWLSGQVFEITGTNVRRWVPWSSAAEIDSDDQWSVEALDTALAASVYRTLPGGRVIPSN
ncbi:SDR family NAD(P)-dependent oxidoreductase [uncultured Jatrophihabitans sp.]|uniref:SDR family NAD(P)-dependent oxidoreductase n=1 Tax=uncultured Jatrophihabitans sp. TaxID=1610747 RepID=UPI0035CA9437